MNPIFERILSVHNYYQQPGGEDHVFSAEADLLESYGHQVQRYTVSNDQINQMNGLTLAGTTIWNPLIYREITKCIRQSKTQVAHFHNTFPLISPSAYTAARSEGVAVIQTLHNYRLICSNAYLFRDGRLCEDCIGKTPPIAGILHNCYRNNRGATASIVAMLTLHRIAQTWKRNVDIYIALTDFARQKFIQGGLPAEKIIVKPNFISPAYPVGDGMGGYALFVGRISLEKGLETLLNAWKYLDGKIILKIVGDGPLAAQMVKASQEIKGIEWLGHKSREEVIAMMQSAKLLILPSLVYENFPVTIAEAFCVGLPVLVSGHGAMREIVDHKRTGLHCSPGDAEDMAAQIDWMLAHPSKLALMRKEARAEFEAKYTAERNYEMLTSIYEKALFKSKE